MNEIKRFDSELLGEHYYRIEHKSGLSVYVFPKDMTSTYGIFSVDFGGSDIVYEIDGETVTLPEGCAHFLEHKLFENEDGKTADDVFSSYGAYDNAYTSNDRTAYLFSGTENIDECIEHLVYFVTHPYFTDKTVQKEIGIIAEEIRGCIDDPYDRCYLNMLGAMYKENPVKEEICGSEESINRITKETLYRCCKDFYTPKNMKLVICGKVTPEQVVAIVDRCLPDKCESDIPKTKAFCEPLAVVEPIVEKIMPVGKPLFCIGIKDINIPSDVKERYKKTKAVNMLLNMLFSEAGEFYLSMLESGLVDPGFDCGYSSSHTTAYVMMSGESDDPLALFEKVKEKIARTKIEGLSAKDFEREKKCHYSSYVSDFDSTEDIAFSLISCAFSNVDIFEHPEIIESIDLEYLEKLLDEVLIEECMSISIVRPEK